MKCQILVIFKKVGKINQNTEGNGNKPKMAIFFKFKFLIALKLNFNEGQFYK